MHSTKWNTVAFAEGMMQENCVPIDAFQIMAEVNQLGLAEKISLMGSDTYRTAFFG
jgi:hypothetical protein